MWVQPDGTPTCSAEHDSGSARLAVQVTWRQQGNGWKRSCASTPMPPLRLEQSACASDADAVRRTALAVLRRGVQPPFNLTLLNIAASALQPAAAAAASVAAIWASSSSSPPPAAAAAAAALSRRRDYDLLASGARLMSKSVERQARECGRNGGGAEVRRCGSAGGADVGATEDAKERHAAAQHACFGAGVVAGESHGEETPQWLVWDEWSDDEDPSDYEGDEESGRAGKRRRENEA
jgi:hypothetical protein